MTSGLVARFQSGRQRAIDDLHVAAGALAQHSLAISHERWIELGALIRVADNWHVGRDPGQPLDCMLVEACRLLHEHPNWPPALHCVAAVYRLRAYAASDPDDAPRPWPRWMDQD